MAQNPPRPAAPRQGGPSGTSSSSQSQSGTRPKDGDKAPPTTFFLGRYRVVDEIGVGGMASVHLGRMDGPGGFQKWVAIKRIHPHLVEDDQFVDMFLDEARIAAGINHANVAQVFDLGKDDNTYWIAMEYLHGEPLREIMRRAEDKKVRISPELAARICSDAAEGLHAAHELRGKNGQLLGLVHRDVTPHNLFLTYEGYTKVVDFGIAKVADRLSSTRAGTLKGKLAYMSPEQVRGAEVDRTTDVFALGVVLWELTTNQRLFRMDTDLDTLEKVQACVVPPPSTFVPDFPPELEQVILKALAKRKQDRFQTAREFSRALQNFLMRRGAFVGPEEVSSFVRQVFADRIQKREAHLAWAAEVTSTINVDQLKAGQAVLPGSAEDLSLVGGEEAEARRARARGAGPVAPATVPNPQQRPTAAPASAAARAPAPAPPPPRLASASANESLMDDDEDVPTTVATREQLEKQEMDLRPRPAAGMPAAGAPPPQQMRGAGPTAAMPAMSGMGMLGGGMPPVGMPVVGMPMGFGPPPAPHGGGPSFGQPPPQHQQHQPHQHQQHQQQQQPGFGFGGHGAQQPNGFGQPFGAPFGAGPPRSDERTAAFQGPVPEDLGSTMALPSVNDIPGMNRGPRTGPPPGNPTFGEPPRQPGFGPPQGYNQGQQGGFSPQGQMGPPQGPVAPQSQIETALSLPRPDPATLWAAQQNKQRADRRNTVVFIAVVALVALCVIGIAALVYLKFRSAAANNATAVAETSAAATGAAPAPPTTAAPTATATAQAQVATSTPAPSAAPSAAETAAPSAPPPDKADKPDKPEKAASAAPSPKAAAADKPDKAAGGEEPGFLTIVCNPYCDDVTDSGRSLGPSPVVHVSVKAGQHRITLKKDGASKVISVIVVSGQVTAQRVSMAK